MRLFLAIAVSFFVFFRVAATEPVETPPADFIPPKVLSMPLPRYPATQLKLGIEGKVSVSFTVQIDGSTSDVTVIEATHKDFAREAVRAVLKWRFTPGLKNGQPVPHRMKAPVLFKMEPANEPSPSPANQADR